MKHLLNSCRRPWLPLALASSLLLALPQATPASPLRRSAVVRAVADAKPAVVNIHGQKTVNEGSPRRVNGMGTGVVVDERGYIVTNYHVVEGVREIKVTLSDGEAYIAKVVAHDPNTDLAVIKINAPGRLATIRIGTSRDLMEGEEVIAVGNAYGYEHTVTRGIVSALHRTVQVTDTHQYVDLIQTDASINPGNSGGPLLNIDGEMVGVNVATRVGAQGIGFAIPVDRAMEVAARLLSAERAGSVWHGIIPECLHDCTGVCARSIQKNSPAQSAGLSEGDVITRVNSLRVERTLDLERAMIGRQPGDEVEIEVNRQGQKHQVRVRLAAATSQDAAPASWALDQAWQRLGMRLEPISAEDMQGSGQFRGGLRVAEVRPNSLGAQQGVMSGDVLVGIHVWVTSTESDLAYVLKSDRLSAEPQVKFYIVRGTHTLFGNLKTSVLR
jgi:serine protease Do